MTRSRVVYLGSLAINANAKGDFVFPQRAWDKHGVVQFEIDNPGDVTGGTVLLTGAAEPLVFPSQTSEFVIRELDMTAMGPLYLQFNVPIFPQMRIRLDSGASSPTANISAYLME